MPPIPRPGGGDASGICGCQGGVGGTEAFSRGLGRSAMLPGICGWGTKRRKPSCAPALAPLKKFPPAITRHPKKSWAIHFHSVLGREKLRVIEGDRLFEVQAGITWPHKKFRPIPKKFLAGITCFYTPQKFRTKSHGHIARRKSLPGMEFLRGFKFETSGKN